jgi:1-acyl-sn-glycerol-3-phosphate acyltransferase
MVLRRGAALSRSSAPWHYQAVRTPLLDCFRPLLVLGARLYWRLRFEGLQHIPRDGPLLITPNHVTWADPPLVSIPIRRAVYYMAWDRLFDIPAFGWLIRRLRAFPVDIETADRRATREAVRLLEAGHALMIFPEAGRSLDGRLGRFRPGAFRLACSLGVPVLPVSIVGGHESWPPGRWLPRPGRLAVIYHPPVKPGPGEDLRGAARTLAGEVRLAIATALPPHQQPAE